jgi:hypothetical protein
VLTDSDSSYISHRQVNVKSEVPCTCFPVWTKVGLIEDFYNDKCFGPLLKGASSASEVLVAVLVLNRTVVASIHALMVLICPGSWGHIIHKYSSKV